jgi:hypothetical protein
MPKRKPEQCSWTAPSCPKQIPAAAKKHKHLMHSDLLLLEVHCTNIILLLGPQIGLLQLGNAHNARTPLAALQGIDS